MTRSEAVLVTWFKHVDLLDVVPASPRDRIGSFYTTPPTAVQKAELRASVPPLGNCQCVTKNGFAAAVCNEGKELIVTSVIFIPDRW